MSIIDGYTITANDLNDIFDTCREALGDSTATFYSVEHQTVCFDGIYQDSTLTNADANLRYWIPVTDARILDVCLFSVDGDNTNIELTITGPMNQDIVVSQFSGSGITRTNATLSSTIGILGGSVMNLRVTNDGAACDTIQAIITYEARWTRT